MTEEEWTECVDPDAMVRHLLSPDTKPSGKRKLILLTCAVLRAVGKVVGKQNEVISACESSIDLPEEKQLVPWIISHFNGSLTLHPGEADPVSLLESLRYATQSAYRLDVDESSEKQPGEIAAAQAEAYRHFIGNPFRPYPKPASWSSTVVQLADSLYQGNTDCRLPLSDALEEAGHVELADHFRKDKWHPKGCWVVDLVLGKE